MPWKKFHNMARPTDYREEFCEMLIQHMAEGHSFESFGAVVKCGKTTLYLWRDAHPEFMNSLEQGRAAHLKFMEKKAMDYMVEMPGEGKINSALFKMFMVNIHGWRNESKDDAQKDTVIKIIVDPEDANL